MSPSDGTTDPFQANVDQAQQWYQQLAALSPPEQLQQFPTGNYGAALNQAENAVTGALKVQAVANKQPTTTPAMTQQKVDAQTGRTSALQQNADTNASRLGIQQQNTDIKGQSLANQVLTNTGKLQNQVNRTDIYGKMQAANAYTEMLKAQVAAGQISLDQAKQKFDQLMAPITAQQAQDTAEMQQGSSRATDASGILNNTFNTVTSGAEHGGFGGAGAMQAMLSAAPGFQAAMGGAPMHPADLITQQQKIAIGQKILAGVAPTQAAIGTAQDAGIMPTGTPSITAPPAGMGPGDNTYAPGQGPAVPAPPSQQTSVVNGQTYPGVPAYGGGGTVPGPVGRPQLAIVHGGEKVIPTTFTAPRA